MKRSPSMPRFAGLCWIAGLLVHAAPLLAEDEVCDLRRYHELSRDGQVTNDDIEACVARCLTPIREAASGSCDEPDQLRCLLLGFFGIECGDVDCQAQLRER